MKIDVETTQGVVTLSGTVKSQADASRAIQLAKQAAGANDVKSTLQISQQH
jgi:osmotically-inducible protein OsmY